MKFEIRFTPILYIKENIDTTFQGEIFGQFETKANNNMFNIAIPIDLDVGRQYKVYFSLKPKPGSLPKNRGDFLKIYNCTFIVPTINRTP